MIAIIRAISCLVVGVLVLLLLAAAHWLAVICDDVLASLHRRFDQFFTGFWW